PRARRTSSPSPTSTPATSRPAPSTSPCVRPPPVRAMMEAAEQGAPPMPKHYVVISSDTHAGPNSPVYRDYLDPEFHDAFDEELAERQALIDARRVDADGSPFVGDEEFKAEWFGEDEEGNSLHEIGLRGGWDAAT